MPDKTKLKVLLPGEFRYGPGDEICSDSVLSDAGRIIDKACVSDAVGDHVFESEDGKEYGVFFEAHLEERDTEYVEPLLESSNLSG